MQTEDSEPMEHEHAVWHVVRLDLKQTAFMSILISKPWSLNPESEILKPRSANVRILTQDDEENMVRIGEGLRNGTKTSVTNGSTPVDEGQTKMKGARQTQPRLSLATTSARHMGTMNGATPPKAEADAATRRASEVARVISYRRNFFMASRACSSVSADLAFCAGGLQIMCDDKTERPRPTTAPDNHDHGDTTRLHCEHD
jgi:hypothetical protein